MRKTVFLLVLALTGLALLLVGCPSEGGSGEQSGVTLRNDGRLPAGFPKVQLKPYPGATITQATITDKTSMCSLETTDSAQQVMDFYADHLTNNGFTQAATKDLGVGRMVSYTDAQSQVSVTAIDRDDSTLINLALSPLKIKDEVTAEEAGITMVTPAVNLPDDFPTDMVPPYPNWDLREVNEKDGEYTVFFNTKDTPKSVADFYQQHFSTLGMILEIEEEANDVRYMGFFSEDKGAGIVLQPTGAGGFQIKVTFDTAWVPTDDYKRMKEKKQK